MTASRDPSGLLGDECGFTLLELLITLALLSLLTLALFSSIRFGTRVWAASESTAEAAESVRDAQRQIAGLVAASYPKLLTPDATHAAVDFDGEPQSLRLLAPDPSHPGAMAHTTLAAAPERSRLALVFLKEPELGTMPVQASRQLLLSGVRTLALAYFGKQKDDEQPVWHDRWRDQTRLPSLVRVRLGFADQRMTWPDLVVSPRIAGDVTCSFDPLTRFCQGR